MQTKKKNGKKKNRLLGRGWGSIILSRRNKNTASFCSLQKICAADTIKTQGKGCVVGSKIQLLTMLPPWRDHLGVADLCVLKVYFDAKDYTLPHI